jgi:hypothetical protein
MRPIQAGSGEQFDFVAIYPRVHAIAVVLDLVQPISALGRFLGEARQLGLNPCWRMSRLGN